jgi:serine protease Do
MTARRKTFVGALLVAIAGISIGALPHLLGTSAYAENKTKLELAPGQLKAAEDLSAAFEYVAEVIKPSVVNISSVKHIKASKQLEREMPQDWPFGDLFGDEFRHRFMQPRMPKGGFEQEGMGSGVIVSADGYVLTNNHVVDGADEVTVTLPGGEQHKAKVVGTDPKSDLAVIKVNAKGLTPATLGDSDKARTGEWVVAVGHPFGLSHTITTGIVSAKGRANMGVADYEDFIQTDAAINPGNSGGPLVNLKGEVIGINTAIFSRTGGNMGIGFAIPSNMAKSIMQSLIEHGKVVRGWMGVGIQNLTEELAQSFGYKGTDGVLVGDVTPDSPAAKAGLKQGDIIVRFEGKDTRDMNHLRQAVAATSPGTKAKLEVFRDGETKDLTIAIGEQETGMAAVEGHESSEKGLGMTLKNLTPDMANELGLSQTKGVLVTEVEPFGVAGKAGIQQNDLILSVHGKPVENVGQFNKELKKHDLDKGVRLTVLTGKMQRFVFLKSEKSE